MTQVPCEFLERANDGLRVLFIVAAQPNLG